MPHTHPPAKVGVTAFDGDHDGHLDLFVSNGRVYAATPSPLNVMPEPWDVYAEPNLFYRGVGGARFELVAGEETGLGTIAEISRGAVAADVDGDGRVDLIVSNVEAPLRIYRNATENVGHWLIIRAVDPALQRDALGARITAEFGDAQRTRTLQTGGGYLTASPPEVHFGLGAHSTVSRLRVCWPDGSVEFFPAAPANQIITLVKGSGRMEIAP